MPAEGAAVGAGTGRRRALRSLLASLAAATSGVLPAFLVGAVGVRIQADLGIGNAMLGLLVSTLFVTAGATSILAGRIVDRMGWASSVRIAAVGSIACLGGIAATARGAGSLMLLLVLGGLAHAALAPAANLALARDLPGSRQGIVFGLKQSSTSAALLLGGLAVPTITVVWGWRMTFLVAIVVPLSAAIAAPPGRRDALAPAPPVGARPRTSAAGHPKGLAGITVAGGAAAATVTASSAFLVISAVDVGVSEGRAGLLLALASIVSLAARIGVGWHADRRQRRSLWSVALLLGVGAAGLLALASGSVVLLVPGAMLAFAAGTGWPGLYHLAVVHRYLRTPAAATGTVQTGLAIGAAIGPLAFGLVVERWSFGAAWSATAATALLASALVVRSARRWRREDGDGQR